MSRARRTDTYRAAGGLRSDGAWYSDGIPVPGQQFGDAVDRVVGDAGEHVAQPGLRIEAVELGGLDQRVDGRGALAAGVGAGEQPVLPAEGDGADRPLGGIVVDLQAPVVADSGSAPPSGSRA